MNEKLSQKELDDRLRSTEEILEKYKQREKELQKLFDITPVGIARVANRKLMDVNRRFCEHLGYNADELIGQSTEICYSNKAEFERVGAALYEQIKKTGQGSLEARGKRKDGTLIHVLISTSNMERYDPSAEIVFAVTDITERKSAELELKKARAFVDNLIRTANVLIIGLDVKGEIMLFNPAAERISGYTREELEGKSWFETIVPVDKYPEVHDEFNRLLKGGLPKIYENPILTKTGEERIINWSNCELREYGRIIGTISFGIDITDRRKAEKALEENSYFLKESQKVARLGSYLLDVKASIWSSSDVLNEIFGIDEDFEKTTMNWVEIVHPEDRKNMLEYYTEHVLGKKQPFDKEYRIVRPIDGEERWVHGLGRLEFNAKGEPVKMIGTIQDITDRKKAEIELNNTLERLRAEQQALFEKNVALNQILNHMENEKTVFRQETSARLEKAVKPFIKKLKQKKGSLSQKEIDLLEDAVNSTVGQESDNFELNYSKLTSREMDICNLIKKNKTSQEIADKLHLSLQTIQKHRNSIRGKLQLRNKEISLSEYLKNK